jgi:LmbE family N-acetylglucosaminyl deacetylase
VSYLLVTRGEAGIDGMTPAETGPLREAEERASAAVVGVDAVDFLEGHTDGVIEYGLPLRRDLAAVIRAEQPDLVVSMNHTETWGGLSFNMADHRNVGLAVLDAARDAGNRWIFTDAGEPWSGVRRVAMGGSPSPTHFVDVGDTIEVGIDSLREHAAYIAGLGTDFDPDAFLRGNARAAGQLAGCEYAAAFQLYEL